MLDKLTDSLGFQAQALVLRAARQQTLASNIANADTPGYAARDFKFADDMRAATGGSAVVAGNASGRHALAGADASDSGGRAGFIPLVATSSLSGAAGGASLGYVAATQPSMDGNTVDLDRERAAFADNAIRYEATLRFINGQSKTLLTAIQGQ